MLLETIVYLKFTFTCHWNLEFCAHVRVLLNLVHKDLEIRHNYPFVGNNIMKSTEVQTLGTI